MSYRFTRWFVALILAGGLIGCGGGGLDEGMPSDLEEAEAEADAEFQSMQEEFGDEMMNP